jgi:hypothetical protein
MKKYIITTALLLCFIGESFAQSFTVSQIKDIKWTADRSSYKQLIIKFTETDYYETVIFHIKGKTTTLTKKNPYYLSDYIPDKFEFSLVGKRTKGKYVVVKFKNEFPLTFELLGFKIGKLIVRFNNRDTITFRQ